MNLLGCHKDMVDLKGKASQKVVMEISTYSLHNNEKHRANYLYFTGSL